MPKDKESMRVGVVVERRRTAHPWQESSWRPVEVIPGAPESTGWRLLYEDDDHARYLFAPLTLELFPGEASGYRLNLSQRRPVVFVLLRRDDTGDPPLRPFHVTVCPSEAQDYLDGGDDIVEGAPMPDVLAAWVRSFTAKHHRETVFEKRRRKPHDAQDSGFHPGPRTGGRKHG